MIQVNYYRFLALFGSPKKPLLGMFLLLLLPCFLFAQSKKELEKKREKLLKEISLTSNLLDETTESKEAALSRYVTLQKQIRKRKKLVETLEIEMNYITKSIDRSSDVAESLQEDIKRLKEEYTQLAQQAYRQKLSNSTLLFVFSADGFNDAFRRWRYVKQYDEYRQKQAQLIQETQTRLGKKLGTLEKRKVEKEELLQTQQKQTWLLSKEMTTRNKMYKNLQKDESRLKKDLDEHRRSHQQLVNAIEKVIFAESSKRIKESRQNTKTSGKTKPSETKTSSDAVVVAAKFDKNKGKLAWPVKSGVITRYFGTQAHPTLKKIKITNNGIDIRTDTDTEARAVFSGVVAGIQFIPGYNNTLIIKHDTYFTVYSNLEEVFVEKEDKIKRLQPIGIVSTNNKTNAAEIHFEVWRDKKRLNPLDWLRK